MHVDPKQHYRLTAPEPARRPWESVDQPEPPPLSTKQEQRAFFGPAITYTPKQQ